MKNVPPTRTKTVGVGAMDAKIFEHGEALIQVRYASVALTPEELRGLYELLKQHYESETSINANV